MFCSEYCPKLFISENLPMVNTYVVESELLIHHTFSACVAIAFKVIVYRCKHPTSFYLLIQLCPSIYILKYVLFYDKILSFYFSPFIL